MVIGYMTQMALECWL